MKIVVCLKQVATRDAPLQIDPSQRWLQEKDTHFETNEADQYALEQALRIKDQVTAEILVVSLGPARVTQVIKEALAKGADRAVHIVMENPESLDPFQQANTIVQAIADEDIDLLLTGLQSYDMGFAQTGVILATLLDLPYTTMVIELQCLEHRIQVKRELESGWYQSITLPVPCALSIQSGNDKPRYANMKGILAAKKKPLRSIDYAELENNQQQASQRILRIYAPEKNKQTLFIEGENQEIAAGLLDKLTINPST